MQDMPGRAGRLRLAASMSAAWTSMDRVVAGGARVATAAPTLTLTLTSTLSAISMAEPVIRPIRVARSILGASLIRGVLWIPGVSPIRAVRWILEAYAIHAVLLILVVLWTLEAFAIRVVQVLRRVLPTMSLRTRTETSIASRSMGGNSAAAPVGQIPMRVCDRRPIGAP